MTQNHLTPHDHFVRKMMSDSIIAREFFEQHLPKHIKDRIQLNTLQLQSESFSNYSTSSEDRRKRTEDNCCVVP